MASPLSRIVPAYLARIVPAALLAAAATLSGAVGQPATACAEPIEWDIGQYDACVDKAADEYHSGNAPRTVPGRVPAQTFQPAPPAVQQPGNIGNVTQTFEPAPVG